MVQKCESCKIKKVSSLFLFSCKCGFTSLCAECRMPEKHNCTYDFKTEGRKLLSMQNPKIEGIKIDKI